MAKTDKGACMLQRLLFALLLAVGVSVGASAGEPGSAVSEPGRKLFRENCAACHGRYGGGDGPVAGALLMAPPDLTQLATRNGGEYPAGLVASYIDGRKLVTAHGDRSMPVWGTEFWLQAGADRGAEAAVKAKIDELVKFVGELQQN
jgi:mono/diheme cytochrome c family protein